MFDADCDLPPGFDIAALEEHVRQQFGPTYPKFPTQFLEADARGVRVAAKSVVRQRLRFRSARQIGIQPFVVHARQWITPKLEPAR